ncbi:MAG TPA: alpha-ketoacid dehydrogenase subunit beta [Chloroflexota bacterium]|nr:alpha-ketoacid dehydrogenase subunit beta [Chloroflexota bacterium]
MSIPSRELTYAEAFREGLSEEMRRDPSVFVMGEEVGAAGGTFKSFDGIFEQFGPERVVDTPIAEEGYVGLGVGAAMAGMRPVIDVMFGDFMTMAMDPMINQAAKMYYMTGGQVPVPMVLHTTMGAGRRSAAQHSQSLHAWFAHIPGLKVVMPATPYDVKGLIKSAIRYDGPVVFYDDKMSYRIKGPVPQEEYLIPLGVAEVKREGTDITVVATSSMVYSALEAADALAKEGVSVEVVDPRTIQPLDMETILASVRKTHRALVVDEGHRSFGASAEIAAEIAEKAFDYLDAPVKRYAAMDVPVPFSPALEDLTIPNTEGVIALVRGLMEGYR